MSDPRFDVTTFGEMLVRFSVPSGERLETTKQLDVHPAGAEANVVTLLARLGRRTLWVGALPENPMGRLAVGALRIAGVHTEGVLWRQTGRMGSYYVEFGPPPRGIQVTYDRTHSCATGVRPEEIDWELLLDTRVLHLTGITPALCPSCAEIVGEAVKRAKQRGVLISFDVNYRQKLWGESEAQQTILPLIRQADLLFCSQADATRLFGCAGSMQETAQQLLDQIQVPALVTSFGADGVLCWDGAGWQHEPARQTQIIDRLGAGDALAAGVLYGWLQGDLQAGLRYGVTLAALALSQKGDMVITTEVEMLAFSRQSSTLTR
ncbi:MAG TPA: sugar kinase [Anaerolineales bacterium]|nr:sugar kinase [Anaerolineales bacterium]